MDERFDDVVRKAHVLDDVLATQQHDLRRFGRGFF